ncbi:MAG: hypothetical protein WCF23_10090 [Candidatus Nitrosopolaris sp.]
MTDVKHKQEDRPRIDRVAEKILGVIGIVIVGGLTIVGVAIVVYGLYVPMFVATAPLFLGVVMIVGGILIIWAIWRHFVK